MEARFWKTMLFIALLGCCVFLGVELASSGLERVAGPGPAGGWDAWAGDFPDGRDGGAAVSAAGRQGREDGSAFGAEAGAEGNPAGLTGDPAAQEAPNDPYETAAAPPEDVPRERWSLVNAAANGLGELLRYIARGLIRFIADAFSAVVH